MAEYAETAAVLAALNGDEEEVERIVADFYPSERLSFLSALDMVGKHLAMRCAECGGYIASSLDLVTSDQQRHRACPPGSGGS